MSLVNCSICKSSIEKDKTYAMADGTRACRVHPEAQQAAENARKANIERMKKASQASHEQKNRKPSVVPTLSLVPQCFCCGKNGIHQQEFYMRVLLAQKKMEIKGIERLPFKVEAGLIMPDPEYTKHLRENMKKDTDTGDHIYTCLSSIRVEDFPQVKSSLRPSSEFAVGMTGYAMLCPSCIDKLKINLNTEPSKTLTPEQMKNWTTVAALMEPELDRMARAEMSVEKVGK